MSKNFKKYCAVILGVIMAATALTFTGCKEAEIKDKYEVSYNLNYSGAEVRTVNVARGANAVSWRAYREGYVIDGGYTNAKCSDSKKFDFDKRIGEDITLYANWAKEKEKCEVTFYENTKYSGIPYVSVVKNGEKITERDIPTLTKKGFNLEGWYTEPECVHKWDFENDEVTENTSLYANFIYDASIQRDENGKPIYEDVNVNVWLSGASYGTETMVMKLAEQFNKEYEGKIHVNASTTLAMQGLYSMRLQMNLDRNSSDSYWAASDIYDMAAIEYDRSDWYENAINDCFIDGKLGTIPLAANVPYIVYNKQLMAEYSDGVIPENYAEFSALFKKAYEGEHAKNANFKSFVSGNNWEYSINTSYGAYIQNGAEYFSYENNAYVNKYGNETVAQNAVGALNKMRDTFGEGGANNGRYTANDKETYKAVSSGDALMGIVNWYGSTISIARALGSPSCPVDVMPLSYLFADNSDAIGARIPVMNIGFAFCNFESILTNTELAAAAVFADYVSKNSIGTVNSCWYPTRKSVVESTAFTQPKGAHETPINLMKKIGDPNNFYSMAGHFKGMDIISNVVWEENTLPYVEGEETNADKIIKHLQSLLIGEIAR